jgi:hypothetical protein
MKITIEFSTASAAFEINFDYEVASICAQVANKQLASWLAGEHSPLYDTNGNKVGSVSIEPE